MLTPIGRLLPLMLVIIPPIGIPVLVPLALVIIPSIGIPVLVPLAALMTIPAVGIALGLMPLTLMAIPAVGIAVRLIPLTVLAMPAICIATWLLPPMRTIPGVSMGPRLGRGEMTIHLRGKGTRLGPGESLTIRLRGKRTIRSGLSAQGAQGHKQTQRENNAPPSFWFHLIILRKKILHSGFVCNLESRPCEKVNDVSVFFKNSSLNCRISPGLGAGNTWVGVARKELQ